MKVFVVTLFLLVLSACHHHAHTNRHHPIHVAKAVNLLQAEHQQLNIVVVNKPRKRLGCWKHARHWHCNR